MVLLALRESLLIPAWYWALALGDGMLMLCREALAASQRD